MAGIGNLNETPLHAALKHALAPAGSTFEVRLDGFVIDAVHEGLLIEVQTRHLRNMRKKLEHLLPHHRMRVVLPVTLEKWIVKQGATPTRRRSPKRGHVADIAHELVAIPDLIDHPNLEFEVALVHEEEVREHREGVAWRRRGWVTVDRRLVLVVERHVWQGHRGLLALLPPGIEEPFGSAQLARASGMRRDTAQKLLYTLRQAGALTLAGKEGNALFYERTQATPPSVKRAKRSTLP